MFKSLQSIRGGWMNVTVMKINAFAVKLEKKIELIFQFVYLYHSRNWNFLHAFLNAESYNFLSFKTQVH